jgi:hypothetical protein
VPVDSAGLRGENRGAGRPHRTKNASQASDLAVGLGVPTARFLDVEPETRFFRPAEKVFDAKPG